MCRTVCLILEDLGFNQRLSQAKQRDVVLNGRTIKAVVTCFLLELLPPVSCAGQCQAAAGGIWVSAEISGRQ